MLRVDQLSSDVDEVGTEVAGIRTEVADLRTAVADPYAEVKEMGIRFTKLDSEGKSRLQRMIERLNAVLGLIESQIKPPK